MIALVAIITLLLSGFFSGMEIAFVSASRLQIELKRKEGSRRRKILAKFFEKPSEFLGTTLMGNTISLVIFGMAMEHLILGILGSFDVGVAHFIASNDFAQLMTNTLIITIIVLIFGEFIPKALYRLKPNRILFFLTYPLYFINLLLFPIVWITVKLSYLVLRLALRIKVKEDAPVFTRLDLKNFIKNITPDSQEEIDTELFENALYLPNIRVKECMIPRTEIVGLDINDGVGALKDLFLQSSLSKIIIYDEDIDNVLGYVHHQQMLDRPSSIKPLILPIPIVPAVMGARDLMNRLIKQRTSVACVVDEFGGTAGIITLEDILEEIVGEIEDEHDEEEYIEQQISENEFLFSGRLEVAYLNEKYNLNIPEGEYNTLSGYIVTTTERIPKQGRHFVFPPYKYVLDFVSETKIETIRVIRLGADE